MKLSSRSNSAARRVPRGSDALVMLTLNSDLSHAIAYRLGKVRILIAHLEAPLEYDHRDRSRREVPLS